MPGARVKWSGPSTGEQVFARVLVAARRPPQLAALNLAAAGLKLDEHGTPVFDRQTLQCGESAVSIAGDAGADRPLHEASSEGAIAGCNADSFPTVEPAHRGTVLSIMFTDPPVAVVGDPPAPSP